MESRSTRPPLTPVSVVTSLVILAMLGAIGSAQLFQFGEAKRRTQCANNLRQLAIAVHVYHDINNALPPLATDDGHFSWVALLLPYVEQATVAEKLKLHLPAKDEVNLKTITAFKAPWLLCPSRRTTSSRKEGGFKGAQAADYVAVSTVRHLQFTLVSEGPIVFREKPPTETERVRSVTSLASVLDGTSNTAMIGEKHVLKDWLDGKFDEPALVAMNNQNTIRLASDIEWKEKDPKSPRLGIEGEDIAKARGLAADEEKDKDKLDKDDWKFGGPHPGITHFARCDASITPVKNSADPKVLRWFCGRSDQMKFELP